jgi:arsenate reductase
MKTTLYGIKNCDTMKKARSWLESHGVEYDFHDYKAAGVARADLQRWIEAVGWEVLLNRAGTTFRALPDASKANIDERKAITLMLARGGTLLVGFSPERYSALKQPGRPRADSAGR